MVELVALIYAAIGIVNSWDGALYLAVHVLFWPAVLVLYAIFFGADLLGALDKIGESDRQLESVLDRMDADSEQVDAGGGF